MEKVEIIYNLHVLIMIFKKLYYSRPLGQDLETVSWWQLVFLVAGCEL